MQKNLLVGNGINIQFGGVENYSNPAIMKRALANVRSGKYQTLLPGATTEDILNVLNGIHKILCNIKKYRPHEEYLLLLMEIERVSKQYNISTPIENVGMEDFFLGLEYLIEDGDSEEAIKELHRELQMIMLDAIYNDGKIEEIDFGSNVGGFLSSYDNVFTINYDHNIDKYVPNVHHLHGDFDVLAPEYNSMSEYSKRNPEMCKAALVIPEYKHVYSNTIMSWYWLEKYGEWLGKEKTYGVDQFKNMRGTLDIIGMSPCNDEQLFLMINLSQLSSVTYYSYSEDDKERMNQKIKKELFYKNVEELWESLK